MEYTIVSLISSVYQEGFLVPKVNSMIEKGWTPLGGIGVNEKGYYQAMTRSEADKPL